MMVVRAWMWPDGSPSDARLLSTATVTCTGARDGRRQYDARLMKDVRFRGPVTDADVLNALKRERHWRRVQVSGHTPGKRGVWDLMGAVLEAACGARLRQYRAGPTSPGELLTARTLLEGAFHFLLAEDPVVLAAQVRRMLDEVEAELAGSDEAADRSDADGAA